VRAIITYHSIDSSGSPISIAEPDFRRHIRWLAKGRVRVLPLEDVVSAPEGDDAVALTFDDAFQNFGSLAAPLLEENSMPATLFVATSKVGGTNAWDVPLAGGGIPVLPLLDWGGIAGAAQRGIAIGSHSRTHRRLPSLDNVDLRDEVAGSSSELCRELGIAATAFSYPYGEASLRVKDEAARVYKFAVTTDLRALSEDDDPRLLPRIDAYYLRARGRLESFGTPAFNRYVGIRNSGRRLRASVSRLLGSGGG
jgi:peptidoglycan/xylan/chitin deacetylase (PgdA/CDA1 family)